MASLSELGFFVTPPTPCSYLEGRVTTTLFVDPRIRVSRSLYNSLSAAGFRRSGAHIYRPFCEDCSACVPIRIPVQGFTPSKSQKRILRRNRDLVIREELPGASAACWQLYKKYIEARHSDGDMHPPSEDQYRAFLAEGRPETRFITFRLNGRLVIVSVVDLLDDGISAIYTCFDPDLARRSPGAFSILHLIQAAAERQLSHLYLGYWIRQCHKMNYKTSYRPSELFINNRWVRLV